MADKGMRTDLGRVRGLGTAKEGVHHWWMQRLTAIALIPLTLWFIISIATLNNASYTETVNWLSIPLVSIFMILLVSATLYHALLGVQVVVEDYIHQEGFKFLLLIGLKFIFLVLGVVAIFSLLKIAL
jgi:succinate dehydrogenase / fumarate reductase membrane anchor subunit|tara:strand:+ start:221 stop:604 length:384 start_codon:yes stop_codon:yes gene_type:complete